MKIISRETTIKGERALAIDPEPKVRVKGFWNSRLNFYSGRTLTRAALEREQKSRSNHLAICSRKLSAGVVQGLDLSFERMPSPDENEALRTMIRVEPGTGITSSGELVYLGSRMEAILSKLQVEGQAPDDPTPPAGIGVLLLEPVFADDAWAIQGGFPCDIDRSDNAFKNQCEIDPADDAFENFRLLDGCRLVWFPWPGAWPLPTPPYGDRLQNLVAHEVFEQEIAANGRLPWDKTGVPLSLLNIAPDGSVVFADRYGVVRQGGGVPCHPAVFQGRRQPLFMAGKDSAICRSHGRSF